MGPEGERAISEAIRILFIFAIPVTVVVAVAGTIVSALQSAMAMRDPATGYLVRLIALLLVLSMVLPGSARSLGQFLGMILGGQ